MKILVKYSPDLQQEITMEFDIDKKTSLKDVAELVAKSIKNDIVLLPIEIKAFLKNLSLEKYCNNLHLGTREFHFNAINRSSLTHEEQAVLKGLNLDLTLPTENSKEDDVDYNLHGAQNFIHFLRRILPEDMQQALIVRLSDKIDMFGRTYKDTLSNEVTNKEARYSVQIHPYPWLAAGASNVIVHKNVFNELSVALVYNQRRDRRLESDPLRKLGIPDFWKLPEGYMHPKPCKGGETGISLVSSDEMDEAEELILKNLPMNEAYKTIKAKGRGSIASHQSHAYDNSTKECATRESYEEVGYKASIQDVQFVSQREENRLIPTIANVYLIRSKSITLTPPDLTVDGVEIKEGIWGKLKSFRFEKDNTKPEKIRVTLDYYDEEGNCYAVEIPLKYALMVGQAIRKFRNDEIQNNSLIEGDPLFTSRENIEARIKQILNTPVLNRHKRALHDILGVSPESVLQSLSVSSLPGDTEQEKNENLKSLANLGKDADIYYKKIAVIAKAFKHSFLDKPLNAEQLIEIANEVPIIESNYYQSKIRLFPLARQYSQEQKEKNVDISSIPRLNRLGFVGDSLI